VLLDKTIVLHRLEKLVTLCNENGLDNSFGSSSAFLFDAHLISVQEMIKEVRELKTGKNVLDPDSERSLMINVMKNANKVWKLQNKIKNGEWDGSEHTKLHDEVEDFIAQGQKINAIKHYRHVMDETFDTEISLKGAKDYVDALANDMRRRGVIE
jgi:ribosomal protein L7/L12